jgi:Molecular chaperone, HSP90 family
MPGWLKPSGQFGLGLQSIFLIADKFEMITKAEDEPGKKIIFENGNNNTGYITVEANDRHERGTTVKIHIDEAKIEASDIQTDELSFKLKDKKDFIMELIINKAKNNQFIGELGKKYKKASCIDMKNYFEVSINKIDNFNEKKEIGSNKSLFSDNSLGCFLENGELQVSNINSQEKLVFEYFERESKSLCRIAFVLPKIEDYEEGERFNFDSSDQEICELYFKNVFVCELYSNSKYMFEEMKYFKFSLNLFDNKADSILEISRNAIKENYRTEFSKVTRHTLINVFQAINNNLIEKKIDLEAYNLTILYQLFKFFGINTRKFMNMYENKLQKVSFWEEFYCEFNEDRDEIKLNRTFDEIFKARFKIIDPVDYRYHFSNLWGNLLDKIDDRKVEKIDTKEVAVNELEVNKYLPSITFDRSSLISYSTIASKIVKLNNEFYYFFEYAPFIISDNQILQKYDEIFLIDEFVNISKEKEREMIGLDNFKNLAVEKIQYERLTHIIKLPFKDEHYDRVLDSIKNDHAFDKKIFKKEVMNTDYFYCLIDHVSSEKKLHTAEIIHAYEELIDKYIELLIKPDEEDNPYKEFVKCLVYANEKAED